MLRRTAALTFATACFLIACGTVTTVPLAWRDPAYSGGAFDQVFVIGIGEDDTRRRFFEDRFVAVLVERGIHAVPSYASLPSPERMDKDAIRDAMEAGGFEAVIVTRLVGQEQEEEFVPPRTYTVPSSYRGGYYGFYQQSYEIVQEPGYYKTNTIVRLETNLYEVASAALVWSGQSETLNPASIADTIDSATAAVARRLAEDGLIR